MLPQDFINRTKELLQDEYDLFEPSLNLFPPTSIRMNPGKSPAAISFDLKNATENPLTDHNIPAGLSNATEYLFTHHDASDIPGASDPASGDRKGKIPWCRTGYFLPERPSFTFDPLFHAGAYYVQEASSMFLEQAVAHIVREDDSLREGITALDLCAAPGGKSTHLLALLPEKSLLVCNEVIRSRSMILTENLTKWGSPRYVATCNDPADFRKLKSVFDLILADLPCSGEGLFRKEPASRREWSLDRVKRCASRQRRIIYDVWDALRPGGWLIYSTCTFNTEENEENVYRLANELGAEVVPVPVRPEWGIAGSLRYEMPVYRFFPHRTRGEGYFLALMRKNRKAEEGDDAATHEGNRERIQTQVVPPELNGLLAEPEKFVFLADCLPSLPGKQSRQASVRPAKQPQAAAGQAYAIPEESRYLYRFLAGHLKIIAAGITLGACKGRDFIPSVSLALNTALNPDAFPTVDLPYDHAIKYLKKESFALPERTPGGFILLTCRHLPLGFVKNIGNRANNLYPQEWRIRSR